MSNSNENKSDLQQAAENVDTSQIEKNLDHDKKSDAPEQLSDDEKTPFMDDKSRTDKQLLLTAFYSQFFERQ